MHHTRIQLEAVFDRGKAGSHYMCVLRQGLLAVAVVLEHMAVFLFEQPIMS